MQHGHSARIRNLFDVFIPLTGPSNLEAVPLLGSNFGFALGEKNNGDNCLQYHVQLVFKHNKTNEDVALTHCFEWARRSAIRFQRSDETQQIEGIIIRIKLPPKLFDFRKHRTQQTRIQVNEIKNGQIIKQAFSNIVQILPKSRTAHSESTVKSAANHSLKALIPVFWAQDIIPLSPISPVNLSSYVTESPLDEFGEEIDELQTDYNYESELQYLSNNNNNSEQYMVLCNGNAEVIGNFRALNFYKSSDINIKEDIRLLTEDKDCRDTLLQIDGVNYKFKKGVHPDTNRRFVGYIAQQVESIVPEAVQLINGILHVDYESLIPYLSESVRANYGDINDLRTKTDRIQRTIDEMYEQFVRKMDPYTQSSTPTKPQRVSRTKKIVLFSVIVVTVLAALLTTLAFTGVIPVFSSAPEGNSKPVSKIPQEYSTAWKDFYYATNGDTWLKNDNWLNEQVSVCEWYGVVCEQEERISGNGTSITIPIVKIVLVNNNLTGTLPSTLYNITWLHTIDLRNNSVTGSIPDEFMKIDKLEELRLADNNLKGTLPNIAKYPKLKILDLSRNQFYGTFPEGFFDNLAELYLANNQIEGPLPPYCKVSSKLDLSSNYLNGSLPFFGIFVVHLDLSNNMFRGWAASATSTNAIYLNLANNNLYGPFSISSSLQFSKMRYLNISNNQFSSWQDEFNRAPEKGITCDATNNQFACPLGSAYITSVCHATCK